MLCGWEVRWCPWLRESYGSRPQEMLPVVTIVLQMLGWLAFLAGTITLGEATQRELGDEFACEDLGVHQLRGRKVPVRAYCIRC